MNISYLQSGLIDALELHAGRGV